jgi:nitrogen fixation protein NifQ
MNTLQERRNLLQTELLARPAPPPAVTDPLRPVLASLLVGRSLNQGMLTATLGLPEATFLALWQEYFPGEPLVLQDGPGKNSLELDDIHQLLLGHLAGTYTSEVWLARIVAYACGGRDHLWQDLGLANRGELSALMTLAFPTLAVLNVGDMKWKKFIYRHYCSTEGIYLCPAPSCGECADRAKCYAPEK